MYKNWGQPGEENKPDIENLDNYLAAIDSAKKELSDIRDLINDANKEREKIESGNDKLTSARMIELENKLKDVEALKSSANLLHSANSVASDDIEAQYQKLSNDTENLNIERINHLRKMQEDKKTSDSMWNEIHNNIANIKLSNDVIDAKAKSNEDSINKILAEHKSLDDKLSIIELRKTECNNLHEDSNYKLDSVNKLKLEIENKNKEADKKLEEANKILEEITNIKSQTDKELQEIIKNKESIKDLIIENKKSKFESNNARDIAQKQIADANQKIAELKSLKEALAN